MTQLSDPLQTVSPKFMGGYSAAIMKRLPAEDGINGVKTMSTFRMRKITVKNSCFQGAPTANLGSGILACFGVLERFQISKKNAKKNFGGADCDRNEVQLCKPKEKTVIHTTQNGHLMVINFFRFGAGFFFSLQSWEMCQKLMAGTSKNDPIEKENHLNQSSIFGVPGVSFEGSNHFHVLAQASHHEMYKTDPKESFFVKMPWTKCLRPSTWNVCFGENLFPKSTTSWPG